MVKTGDKRMDAHTDVKTQIWSHAEPYPLLKNATELSLAIGLFMSSDIGLCISKKVFGKIKTGNFYKKKLDLQS